MLRTSSLGLLGCFILFCLCTSFQSRHFARNSPQGGTRRLSSRAYALSQKQILNLNVDAGQDVTLETFVLRFVKGLKDPDNGAEAEEGAVDVGAIVDLFGVLHVADSSYYQELSKVLEQYDVVLYELITSNSNVDLVYGQETQLSSSKEEVKPDSKTKEQIPTKHKYLGAAVAGSGDIYGVPAHARKLLRITGRGEEGLSLLSLVDSESGESINMNKRFKWLRGQVYKESIYCIPAWADSVLKLNLSTAGKETIEATELGKNVISRVKELLQESDADARWLYHGAAEGRDGCIYAIPCNAEFVLKIDPVVDEISLVGYSSTAQFGKLFGTNNKAKLPAGGNKWYGAIRGVDGCVYGMPYCTRDGVLKITPPQSYSTEEEAKVRVIPTRSLDSTSPRTMSLEDNDDDKNSKLCRWHGGVLNPADGFIYAIPSHSRSVLRINTNIQIDVEGISGGDNDVAELIGGEGCIPQGSYKWGGGAVGTDGRVYGIPSDSDKVLVVDPATTSSLYGNDQNRENYCDDDNSGNAGVRLLDIPSYVDGGLDGLGEELPRINKWQGGLLVGNSIYCFPCNAVSVLKITTPEMGSFEQAVVTEIGVGVIPKGRCKWQGGNYNRDEHCIYCVPEHGDSVLRINCSDDFVSLHRLPRADDDEPSDQSAAPTEEVQSWPQTYITPRRRLNTDIQSPTAAALAGQYGLRTQLDLPMNLDKRYFLADLDSETMAKMESDQDLRDRLRRSYQVSQSEGLLSGSSGRDVLFDRSSSSPYIPRNNFRVDGPFLAVARLASWLTPAPELSQLLLDWSRSRDRAKTGGVTFSSLNAACQLFLSSFSPSTLFLPSKEGLARARQILFAQQLVSGVADDGWFGGSALSDVGVRVEERNKAAVEVLKGVLSDEDKPRVAVLYGVYHLKDLARRFEEIGLSPLQGSQEQIEGSTFGGKEEGGKEVPRLPPNNRLVAWRMAMPSAVSPEGLQRYSAALLVGSLYLVASTLDWLVLLRLVIKAIEALPLLPSIASISSASDALPVPVPTVSLDRVSDDQVVDFSLGLVYLSLYIRRHRDILVSFTTGIVDWNKGLYDDDDD